MSFILYSNQGIIYIQWNAWILSMEFNFDKCIYPCNSALSRYRGHPDSSTWYLKKSLWLKFSGFSRTLNSLYQISCYVICPFNMQTFFSPNSGKWSHVLSWKTFIPFVGFFTAGTPIILIQDHLHLTFIAINFPLIALIFFWLLNLLSLLFLYTIPPLTLSLIWSSAVV